MNERPTPETDEAQWGTGRVTTAFARKLERERDEAIADYQRVCKERDEARNLFESSKRARASLNEALDKTLHELREAREQLAAAKHFLEKYIAERDEARRKCANLEEIIRVEWPIATAEALIRQAKESAK